MKERIQYLDFMKGVGIILLVSFHIRPEYKIHQTFLMPMFFFLSGLNFRVYDNFVTFIKRKTNTLLIPFVFFLLTGALYTFLSNLVKTGFDINSVVALMKSMNPIDFNTPLWFVIVLIEVFLIYYALNRLLPHWLCQVVSLLMGLIGFWIVKQWGELWLFLDLALVAIPFFALGVQIAKLGWLKKMPNVFLVVVATIFVIAWVWYDTPVINMIQRRFPDMLRLYVMTPAVVLCFFFVSHFVKKPIIVISFFGRYSLIILGTHYFLIGLIRAVIEKVLVLTPFYSYLLIFLLTLALEFPMIYCLNKLVPRLVGSKLFF